MSDGGIPVDLGIAMQHEPTGPASQGPGIVRQPWYSRLADWLKRLLPTTRLTVRQVNVTPGETIPPLVDQSANFQNSTAVPETTESLPMQVDAHPGAESQTATSRGDPLRRQLFSQQYPVSHPNDHSSVSAQQSTRMSGLDNGISGRVIDNEIRQLIKDNSLVLPFDIRSDLSTTVNVHVLGNLCTRFYRLYRCGDFDIAAAKELIFDLQVFREQILSTELPSGQSSKQADWLAVPRSLAALLRHLGVRAPLINDHDKEIANSTVLNASLQSTSVAPQINFDRYKSADYRPARNTGVPDVSCITPQGQSGFANSSQTACNRSHANQSVLDITQQEISRVALKSVPIYEGKNFDQWMEVVHSVIGDGSLPVHDIRCFVSSRLSGHHRLAVAQWITTYDTWDEIRDRLNREYSEVPDPLQASLVFVTISQGGEELAEYHSKFLTALWKAKKLKDTEDIEVIMRYVSGLDNAVWKRILIGKVRPKFAGLHFRPKSLSDVMHCTRGLFLDQQALTRMNSNVFSRSNAGAVESSTITTNTAAADGSKHLKRPYSSGRPGDNRPNKYCKTHDSKSHDTGDCRADQKCCPYCKQAFGQDIADHHKNCTSNRCKNCNKRGHQDAQCSGRQVSAQKRSRVEPAAPTAAATPEVEQA